METPDKIYTDNRGAYAELPVFSQADANVAYIRKDALLAFLNERRKGLTSGDSFVAGERKMLKEIIEKIESL